MTVELTLLISIFCAVGGFLVSFLALRRHTAYAVTQSAERDGTLFAEMGYVKSGIDDIKREQREQAKINIEILTRLTAVEASSKQAHKRLDGMDAKNAQKEHQNTKGGYQQ